MRCSVTGSTNTREPWCCVVVPLWSGRGLKIPAKPLTSRLSRQAGNFKSHEFLSLLPIRHTVIFLQKEADLFLKFPGLILDILEIFARTLHHVNSSGMTTHLQLSERQTTGLPREVVQNLPFCSFDVDFEHVDPRVTKFLNPGQRPHVHQCSIFRARFPTAFLSYRGTVSRQHHPKRMCSSWNRSLLALDKKKHSGHVYTTRALACRYHIQQYIPQE